MIAYVLLAIIMCTQITNNGTPGKLLNFYYYRYLYRAVNLPSTLHIDLPATFRHLGI